MPFPETCISSTEACENAVALTPVSTDQLPAILDSFDEKQRKWLLSTGFQAKSGSVALLAGDDGALVRTLIGTGKEKPSPQDPWWLAAVVDQLPAGDFYLDADIDKKTVLSGALGWCLSHYSFDRYKPAETPKRTLIALPEDLCAEVKRLASATATVRDLVNTPAEHMGPAELQDAAEALAEKHGATSETIVGDDLLDHNFPAIHAVGRAAAEGREPRLIDLNWGPDNAPKLTLVGKGVCFDTGGLDLKPGAGMRWMKKDMGGAAHVLGLAQLIMETGLDVRLRVLISAVENSVAGSAYRPGDVIDTRKGLTVEVGNTDAEGRIVLCDALTLACEENPDLLIDFATLTGAARVALGADLPATYSNHDALWGALESSAKATGDPLWRMPLWDGYDGQLSSTIADLSNIADSGFAGSITAALYLQRFVDSKTPWSHLDTYAWSQKPRPGRPMGGEAQGMRAAFAAIQDFLDL